MRGWFAIGLLAACGHSGGSKDPDAPLPIDAKVCDCELPIDSYFPDSTVLGPGTHTFNIEIADELADPTGNWVLLGILDQNRTVNGITDASGQVTTINVTTSNWNVQDGNPATWTAGNQGWLQAVAAQDTWAASVGNANPSRLILSNLDGRYKVEVVVAHYNDNTTHRVNVNGANTTTTFKGASGKNSMTWKPLDDGTTPGDWLIWPDVNPSAGAITVEVLPGRLNAVRFSPP